MLKDLIRKIRLVSKFVTSQPGKQTIVIRILPNALRGKGNQTMKFGQLIEYNIIKNFLQKSYTKRGGETIPRPFSKSRNRAYLRISSLKFYTFCFYCMKSWGLLKYIETKLQTIYKEFLWNKKNSGANLPASFCPWFLKKNIYLLILY